MQFSILQQKTFNAQCRDLYASALGARLELLGALEGAETV